MEPSELAIIGLTSNLVGVFLLANSIVFRRQRKVVEEFFGVGAGSLNVIRDYSLNKVQVVIGFLFLNTGFLLQGFALLDQIRAHWLTAVICLGMVGLAGVAYFIGLTYSRRSFRRHLCEFFQKNSWDFHENMALTKDIGQTLGVPHKQDESVEEYVRKVVAKLGLAEDRAVPSVTPRLGVDRGRKLRDLSALTGR